MTTGIGKTGVVGAEERAGTDALVSRRHGRERRVREATGLPWAATKPQTLADGSEVD